jgi:hypothetical protein
MLDGQPEEDTEMPKGHGGEPCAEAIRASIGPNEVVPASELTTRVKKRGTWKDETICQHLMALVVNLPPAREHWLNARPFLFLRPDGQCEFYGELKHPKTIP